MRKALNCVGNQDSERGFLSIFQKGEPQNVYPRRVMSSPKSRSDDRHPKIEMDARGYPRYPVHKIVLYKYRGRQFLTLTLDLAMGGMKIKSRRHLQGDKLLQFKLVLGENSIWLKGRIVYSGFVSDKQRVSGIQFTELSPNDYGLLQRYLATLEEWPSLREGSRVKIRWQRGHPGIGGEIEGKQRAGI